MKTLIRTKGYILDFSVIDPITEKLTGSKIYRLSLMPESPSVFEEIEDQLITKFKQENAQAQEVQRRLKEVQ